jgi:hypothetical protein
MGARNYTLPSFHIQTWSTGGGGGLDVQLLQAKVEPQALELVFRMRAGDRGDLLLYEPPRSKHQSRGPAGATAPVDEAFEELYIQDDTGTRSYSTTGLIGGRQLSFNNYNLVRKITFGPGEQVVVSARFPPVRKDISTISFISPALNGWQSEWRSGVIPLR